jgi:thioredoxin-dependent peroxiredoxin
VEWDDACLWVVIVGDGVIRVARYNVRAKGHVDSLLRALDKLDGSVF